MISCSRLLITVLLISTQLVFGQVEEVNLKSYVLDLQSTDLNPKNSTNWEKLKIILKDKRIIFLGESDHGDGATIKAKTKLIQFLNHELNFDVLILEKNIYEMHAMSDYLLRDYNKDYILIQGFRNEYYSSKATAALRNFIKEGVSVKKNLTVAGLDIVYQSWFRTQFVNDLKRAGVSSSITNKYRTLFDQLYSLQFCMDCVVSNFDQRAFLQISNQCLDELAKSDKHKLDLIHFLQRVIKSNIGLSEWIVNRGVLQGDYSKEKALHFFSYRDKVMADNLLWYLNEVYPNKKIIVSTSTYHMTRNLSAKQTLADYLPDSLQEQAYYMPFIFYQGKFGFETDTNSFKVDSVERGHLSLEYKIHNVGVKQAFLDFNSLSDNDKKWINNLSMSPSEKLPENGKWTEIYDGFFMIDKMEPDYLEWFSLGAQDYFENELYKE